MSKGQLMPKRSVGAILTILLLADGAAAGVLRGELRISRGSAETHRPGGAVGPGVDRGVEDAVVYVEQIPDQLERRLTRRGWFAPKPKLPRIVQSHLRFVPRVLAVPVGTAVEFQNLDGVYHNAFSVSASKRFDLGRYPPGALDTVAFEHVGVLNLHCDLHPDEIGYVVVVPNHAWARPDSLGRFTLTKLPQGKYTIRAWHPGRGELRREVEIPPHGGVTLELRL